MVPKKIAFEDIFSDEYIRRILKTTNDYRSAHEISEECNIPLMTTYRRINHLLNYGFLDVKGYIINGVRLNKYKRNLVYKYDDGDPRIKAILGIITENPGISYSELKNKTGYPDGLLNRLVSKMSNKKNINVLKIANRLNFFPPQTEQFERNLLIHLRKETSKAIVTFLLVRERSSFKEIKEAIKKSPATTSLVLTKLVELGIVLRVSNTVPTYMLKDKKLVYNSLKKIEPKAIDEFKDRFADTFSYF